ncbi:GntR family transcriptional regulator [Streptomyces sp. NBC_00102]|uniref:GntR family transcriptional regulator n=1 Tax=Streptomyces sp. NBC_00102 TaxID=2975652 RepID=UPI00224D0533|nr:GntR family transcriptional regulator [Streptomyces sp. NBC_00102]MCX5399141.1 GntR family transcriptional regulator [Streptomyces sp. NBC_00102]
MTVAASGSDFPDVRSFHERIAADLRDEIMTGDLAPGVRLPSTAQLKERFEAAGATVQKALHLLKDEGLVVGRAGAAVTVRDHRQRTMRPAAYMAAPEAGRPYRWLSEVAKEGGRARSNLIEVTEALPPADVAAALGLPAQGFAVLRRQLLTIDEEPAELVSSYYSLEMARGTVLAAKRRISGGTPAALTELGYPPARSVDRVSARVPTQEQYRALKLPGDLPVLRTLRVVLDEEGRPLEATVMVKAGHLYEIEYEFTAD